MHWSICSQLKRKLCSFSEILSSCVISRQIGDPSAIYHVRNATTFLREERRKAKGRGDLRSQNPSLHIPLNPAADSERIRPPLGAPRRRASVICPKWPTSVRFG